jgi:hypothetical protein
VGPDTEHHHHGHVRQFAGIARFVAIGFWLARCSPARRLFDASSSLALA